MEAIKVRLNNTKSSSMLWVLKSQLNNTSMKPILKMYGAYLLFYFVAYIISIGSGKTIQEELMPILITFIFVVNVTNLYKKEDDDK